MRVPPWLFTLLCALLLGASPSQAAPVEGTDTIDAVEGTDTIDEDDEAEESTSAEAKTPTEGETHEARTPRPPKVEDQSCTSKKDCKAGQHCADGTCRTGECGAESDCSDAEPYCWDNTCVECRADSECGGLASICLAGQCVECVFDADCWCPAQGTGGSNTMATCNTFNQCSCFTPSRR